MIENHGRNSLVCNDDILRFEDNEIIAQTPVDTWKIIIVDDEIAVHQATKLALNSFVFAGKPLSFLSAYTLIEAKQLIAAHPDTVIAFLDVVIDTNNAGLEVVKYIREELNNQRIRIILRTGQPGEAPEESVILNYDINDYKLKVDLTRQRLITTVIAALRSYRDIMVIESQAAQLSRTQLQLLQSEKMSGLGNLVAGIAHEINNPIGFVAGNLKVAEEYLQNIFTLIDLYQKHYPNPDAEILDEIAEIDWEYLQADLPKLMKSMIEGVKRIRNISNGLRTFSRGDTDNQVAFNIHEGIDSTIMILQHRLKANESRPEIQIIKDYDDLPVIKCFPGQLNQVFMNLIANAIDALDESNVGRSFEEVATNPNQIRIITKLKAKNFVISIQDNGAGISESVKYKMFDNLFTTKAVGKGTGLGLSIARQIIVDKHHGSLTCNSEVGSGTEFVIMIPVLNGED